MKIKNILMVLPVFFVTSCISTPIVDPLESAIPSSTFTASINPTVTLILISTQSPTETPIPIAYVTLASPFAADCGDGVPRVVVDNEFNGVEKAELINSFYGHMDLYPPVGCDIYSYDGEIIAPVSGEFFKDPQDSPSFFIALPQYTLITGTDKVLENSGVSDFSSNLVERTVINISHYTPLPGLQNNAFVTQGQVIGNLEPEIGNRNPIKFAMHIQILYNGVGYSYSPSMFLKETGEKPWECIGESVIPGVGACNLQYNYYP